MFLCLISLIEVYSASSMLTFSTNFYKPILKHSLFLFAGLVIVLLFHSINPNKFKIIFLALPFIWIILIAALFMGKPVNDAARYIFGFQPSEFAKLFLIVSVALLLSARKETLTENHSFKLMWGFSIVTCLLIFSENFSTAAILYCVIVLLMFIGQVSFKRLRLLILTTFTVLVFIFTFVWFFPETAKIIGLKRAVVGVERIRVYKNLQKIEKTDYVVDDRNYQATQAKIALAKGGIFGTMPGNGQQRDFLPQAYSDFIFAIIIEEMGFLGGVFVLALYVFLFIRAGTIAGRCTKLFPKLLVMGCTTMIVIQAIISMAVSVGLIPVTGQPLPLISKGGSSIIVTCAFFGIILSVSRFENPRGVLQEEIIEEEFEEEKRLVLEDEQLGVQAVY